jgi:hypothetical protein
MLSLPVLIKIIVHINNNRRIYLKTHILKNYIFIVAVLLLNHN